jgi:hypothetical protein
MKSSVRHIFLIMAAIMAAGIYIGCHQQMGQHKSEVNSDTLTTQDFNISPALATDSLRL